MDDRKRKAAKMYARKALAHGGIIIDEDHDGPESPDVNLTSHARSPMPIEADEAELESFVYPNPDLPEESEEPRLGLAEKLSDMVRQKSRHAMLSAAMRKKR